MHTPEDHILEALEVVSGWGLPEEAVAAATNQQATLMAGRFDPDRCGGDAVVEPGSIHH